MFIVGLTGGIGSGKTAVSDRFAAKNICIVDADVCSRAVVEVGSPALKSIQEHFGNDVISPNGELDRASLRQIVFANADEKRWLEQLLHPLIAEETFRQLTAATSDYVILVSPLLIEAQQDLICDRVLVVDAPETVQIERTTVRDNNNEEEVKRIINTQASRDARLSKAHDIIENSQGLDHLDAEVEKLHAEYLRLSHKKQLEKSTDGL
jgi:dephospho-CoA kinase